MIVLLMESTIKFRKVSDKYKPESGRHDIHYILVIYVFLNIIIYIRVFFNDL